MDSGSVSPQCPNRAAAGSASRRVRPVKRACADCHARKVKCDGAANGFPCSSCKSAGVSCIIAERRRRRRVSANDSTTSARRTQHPRKNDNIAVAHTPDLPRPEQSGAPDTPVDEDEAEVEADSNTADYAGECELAKQHLVNFLNQDLREKPIQARSTYVGCELSNLNYLVRQRSANQHVYHYPCSNVYVPRVFRDSPTLATPNLIPKDAFVLPPKHVSDVLVADYFRHVHPGFPIIDRDAFLEQYHDPNRAPPVLLLQAVCVVGSHVTKAFKNTQDMKVAFFRRAKALLDGRYEEDRMNVVQAALLLTWFSDGGDDICANAWFWVGLAGRIAVGLGMHREVGPSKMPDGDKRIWRLIWWCLVQFDCLVSLCYGRPQSINLEDCDVSPLSLDDFDESTSRKEANFVMYHTRLCTVVSELVRSHFSVKASKSGVSKRVALDSIDTALAEWLADLPSDLREHARQPGDSGQWSFLLHLTYNTVLVQFHRSMAEVTTNLGGPDSLQDQEICADASANIIRIFQELECRSGLRSCWFWAPSTLFTAMLQFSGQLSCNNPVLATKAKERYDSGLHTLRVLTRYWLFATSVWRLFESSSIRLNGTVSGQGRVRDTAEGISPTQPSPLLTAPSVDVLSNSPVQAMAVNSGQGHSTEMDWVQLLSYDESNADYMNMERNRWQNNIHEWQSLYWSDPLANIRLVENLGEFEWEWPLP